MTSFSRIWVQYEPGVIAKQGGIETGTQMPYECALEENELITRVLVYRLNGSDWSSPGQYRVEY